MFLSTLLSTRASFSLRRPSAFWRWRSSKPRTATGSSRARETTTRWTSSPCCTTWDCFEVAPGGWQATEFLLSQPWAPLLAAEPMMVVYDD
jgi:hypothetical protein